MSKETNIRVVCRFRPMNSLEKSMGGQSCVELQENQVKLFVRWNNDKTTEGTVKTDYAFAFDKIIHPHHTQREVFDIVALPVLNRSQV